MIAPAGRREYREMEPEEVAALARNGALLADLNGICRDAEFPETLDPMVALGAAPRKVAPA